MKLSVTDNYNAMAFLKSTVTEEILDYINRVANINMADPTKFQSFFTKIETELVQVATNRKFQVLNTNVIRETHKRVLADESIRMFYMELMTSIQVRTALELGSQVLPVMLQEIIAAYTTGVLKENSNQQGIVVQSNDERQLAGQLVVTQQATEYLASNSWYYSTILCNFYAASILDQIRVLKKQMEVGANKSQ